MNNNEDVTTLTASPQKKLISIVIPAFNEEEGIAHSIEVISNILKKCDINYEIIIIDDGSADNTYHKVKDLCKTNSFLRGIKLSRNFGKEAAILAGLKSINGDAAITIDADLQHPPALIPDMIEKWKHGAKVVHAVKEQREVDNLVTRLRAAIFNNTVKMLGGVDIRNSSDFKLLDKVTVKAIVNKLPENKRFYRGLASWIGYEQETIYFNVNERQAGEGKWSLKALIGLAITGIVSFTGMPLRIVTILGFLTLVLALGVTIETLWSWLEGTAVSGFSTLIITLLLLGSFIMISLGILGEYIAKIYDEVKARPNFLVDETCGMDLVTSERIKE